jgi:hypothetical protein
MRHDFATDDTRERYVVEVDGRPKAEYRTFAKALTAGLQFRQEFRIATSNCATWTRRLSTKLHADFMLVPLAHMTIVLAVGAAGFYLMHVFAR